MNDGNTVKIGIAGTGRMATAIGRRLLSFGHDLTVWNRTPEKTRALADAGAKVAATPAAVTGASEIVMTILTDAAAIEAVYLGANGLLAGDAAGKLFVEMSTVRSETPRALAEKARAKDAAFVDCPVGGTVGPASEGKLFAFVGGEAADFARVRPVLEQLCRRIEHLGPVGSGATMKLTANLLTQVFWQSLGEALTLARPLGIPPARLLDIFGDMSGAPDVLKRRSAHIAAALDGTEITPVGFDVDSVRKDLRAIVAEAGAHGRRLPLVERALECFDGVSAEGRGGRDCAMLPVFFSHPKGE